MPPDPDHSRSPVNQSRKAAAIADLSRFVDEVLRGGHRLAGQPASFGRVSVELRIQHGTIQTWELTFSTATLGR